MDSYYSNRQRLIVSADDFGLNARANRNILYLISIGKINRVSIMPEGNISAKEINELVKSGVKLDIHLDISSLFNHRKKQLSPLGRAREFIFQLLLGNIAPGKVERKWRQQIEIFKTLFGKNPDGINSHEHVHFFPLFFRITLALQNEYNIPYLRFGKSLVTTQRQTISRILLWLWKFNRFFLGKQQYISCEALVSLDWIKDLDSFLNNPPDGKIEIVCHPALAEDFVRLKKYF